MWSLQYARRFDVPNGVVSEHDNLVARVRFDRVNLPIIRIDIEAVVELDLALRSLNYALRPGQCAGWSSDGALENACCPKVIVLENNFVEVRIDSDVALRGILVPDHPLRLAADLNRRRIRRVRLSAASLHPQRCKQIRVGIPLKRSHEDRIGRAR